MFEMSDEAALAPGVETETRLREAHEKLGRPLKVLVADDAQIVRDSLQVLLGQREDLELVAFAEDGHEALLVADRHFLDVALIDIDMPRVDGIQTTRLLRERHPQVAVLIFTSFERRGVVMDALRAGALGFITKDARAERVARALWQVHLGERVMGEEPAAELAQQVVAQQIPTENDLAFARAVKQMPSQLRKIYGQLALGRSNRAISKEMGLSEGTVRGYVSQVLERTGCESRTALVAKAFANQLVK